MGRCDGADSGDRMGKLNATVSGWAALGLACMMLFPRASAALTLGEVLYACDSKLKENRVLCAGYSGGPWTH